MLKAASLLLLSCMPMISAGQSERDVAGRVEMTLTPDRQTYYVGEPVLLELAVKNVGNVPLYGYMQLQPYLPEGLKTGVLLYCRDAERCLEFLCEIPGVDKINLAIVPQQLEPGRTQHSRFVAALNPKNGRLVLDEPGDVEFRWVTWGIHSHEHVTTRTRGEELRASARVRVLAVPEGETEAYAFYVGKQLSELAQYNPDYTATTDTQTLAARAMLARYPTSIYAEAIRIGFLQLLELKALRGRASDEERELLADLRARHPER